MQKKRTIYQKTLEEEGNGSSSGATNRPKSREKNVTGEGKSIKTIRRAPVNPAKQTFSDEPLLTTGYHKEPANPTVKKPVARKKKVTGIGKLGPTKSGSGRKF